MSQKNNQDDETNKVVPQYNRDYRHRYRATKRGHLSCLLENARQRARRKELDFNLTLDFLCDIAPKYCPILELKLDYGYGKLKNKNKITRAYSPSVDRIDVHKGYTEDNVQIISHKANTMKNNATIDELQIFAKWIIENV